MARMEVQRRKMQQIQEIAKDWGKQVAREVFPDGPGLDVSLIEMEELAAVASKALVRGTIETLTSDQAKQISLTVPCPICERMCELNMRPRPIMVRGGEATLNEPVGHCPACRRDFFPSTPSVEDRRASV